MTTEQTQNTDRPSTMSGEFTKALVEKMVTHGTELREISEQIRQLPNPTPALNQTDQRIAELGARIDQTTDYLAKQAGSMGKMTEEIGRLAQKIALSAPYIDQLNRQMELHARLFEEQLKKKVSFSDFLRKMMIIAGLLVLIIIGLIILLNRIRF